MHPTTRDSRNGEVAALIAELTELGCAEPAVDCEISDPGIGQALAIAEACWPEGLQPGQGSPVVLELDPGESDLARLEELGYEVFTSTDSLRSYVRRRNQEAAGPVEEPVGSTKNADDPAGTPSAGPSFDVRAEFEQAMKDVYVRAKSEALLLVFDETLGFVQGELPWEGIELLAAGSGRVGLDLAGSEKHTHALVTELANRPLERTPVGKRGVQERQDHNWDGEADGLGEEAECVGVADPLRALVDGVVGGGCDDHRIGLQRARLVRRAVRATHC